MWAGQKQEKVRNLTSKEQVKIKTKIHSEMASRRSRRRWQAKDTKDLVVESRKVTWTFQGEPREEEEAVESTKTVLASLLSQHLQCAIPWAKH